MMRGSTTVFTVADVAAGLAYYRDCVGFDVAFEYGAPTFYAGLCSGEVSLHLIAAAQAPRPPGQRAHRRQALEDRLATDQTVGLPQRIDAARLAEIDPAPIVARPGKRKLHQAEADSDLHACAFASGAIVSRWRRISSRLPSGMASSAFGMPAFS